MQKLHGSIMAETKLFVNQIVEKARLAQSKEDLAALEQFIHQQSQKLGSKAYEHITQQKVSSDNSYKICPLCGKARRHKGVRKRDHVTRMGAISVEGVYWYCDFCRRGNHAADRWLGGLWSDVFKHQVVLLGTALTSFRKAKTVCHEVLGIRIDEDTIRKLCIFAGKDLLESQSSPPPIVKGQSLTGSCDGTMVNTRREGWRELRAFQYRYGEHRHGGAFLESAKRFVPRLRRAAIDLQAKNATNIFFLSDAASWITRGVKIQLPTAQHIIDLWHANQHIHQAASDLWGVDNPMGHDWARRYTQVLKDHGATGLLKCLKKIRYKNKTKMKILNALTGFFTRNASFMDYPVYEKAGWPISSGPMESFCKQLGTRLKGPGMRWSVKNVTPIAALVSLWANEEWEHYWKNSA
jgi:hypothetical protein